MRDFVRVPFVVCDLGQKHPSRADQTADRYIMRASRAAGALPDQRGSVLPTRDSNGHALATPSPLGLRAGRARLRAGAVEGTLHRQTMSR